MSGDDWKELEGELRRVRPVGFSAALAERLREEPGAELGEERLTVGDRVLASFAGCGAMAACVIVGVVVWQMMLPRAPEVGAGEVAARQRLMAEYRALELAAR